MASDVLTIPIAPLCKRITIKVRFTGMNAMKVRFWLAAKVFLLGAWIAGTNIEIETDG